MTSLLNLPNEFILMICDEMSQTRDKAHLAQACFRLNSIIHRPYLRYLAQTHHQEYLFWTHIIRNPRPWDHIQEINFAPVGTAAVPALLPQDIISVPADYKLEPAQEAAFVEALSCLKGLTSLRILSNAFPPVSDDMDPSECTLLEQLISAVAFFAIKLNTVEVWNNSHIALVNDRVFGLTSTALQNVSLNSEVTGSLDVYPREFILELLKDSCPLLVSLELVFNHGTAAILFHLFTGYWPSLTHLSLYERKPIVAAEDYPALFHLQPFLVKHIKLTHILLGITTNLIVYTAAFNLPPKINLQAFAIHLDNPIESEPILLPNTESPPRLKHLVFQFTQRAHDDHILNLFRNLESISCSLSLKCLVGFLNTLPIGLRILDLHLQDAPSWEKRSAVTKELWLNCLSAMSRLGHLQELSGFFSITQINEAPRLVEQLINSIPLLIRLNGLGSSGVVEWYQVSQDFPLTGIGWRVNRLEAGEFYAPLMRKDDCFAL
ncbi:hypothetical protein M422DRAFT_269512 [Sphaerobolus stellatus SS14]|uniref:Unplaced genomic scaffold SPHSTscaffold_214, whole genome shotgun sequence n=1 Tax=Sphaerobolus stellatus (strain SS14) TaxID=990650 RepID=A0A0C9U4H6_SPHS4|nr:hypothetical protein M422DRAFT_269512 [Sphaerobolus stellatus SS14]